MKTMPVPLVMTPRAPMPFDKTIHFITDTPNNSGWWDFELVTRGTKLDDKEVKVLTANQVQHFTFDWDTDHYIKICK